MGRPRGLLTYLSVLFAGGVIAVVLPALASGTTRAAAPHVYPSHRANVVGAAVVNFSRLARLQSLEGRPARPVTMPEPQEIPEPNVRKLTLPSPFGTSLLSSASQANTPSPAPVQSFLAQADNSMFVPPDTDGAVGTDKLFTTVNGTYIVEQKSNGAALKALTMATFWGATGAQHPFDPKTFYDPYNGRWLVAAVNDGGKNTSSVLYGVSDSSDPAGTWHLYNIDADATDTAWADYPGVGFNKDHLVITVNMFLNLNNHYEGHAKVYVINYPSLRSGTSGSPTVTPVSGGFTIQPAVTYSATESTLYMVEHWNASAGSYRFLTVSSSGAVSGGTTSLTNPLGPWVQPGTANVLPQAGGHPMDAGDSRILNAVFRNGNIYYAQTIGLGGSDFNPIHTAVQWVELNTSGGFVQGGRIDSPTATATNGGQWYAYPSIAANKNGDLMVGFSEFASSHYPSAAYSVHMSTDAAGTMRDPVVLKTGEGNYFKTYDNATSRNRWGDYSATQVDPSDDTSFWTTQEYSKPPPAPSSGDCTSTTEVACGTWAIWWGKVLGGAAPPPSDTLTVSKAGTGSGLVTGNGINCGVTCSASFTSGTVVSLSESHNALNTTFGGWSGACSGTGACSITMNGAKAVTAIFNQKATPPRCLVPKVVGKKLAAAKTKIRAAHCKVGKIIKAKSSKKKKGRVIRQKPAAGKHLANGSKVNLTVGRGSRR